MNVPQTPSTPRLVTSLFTSLDGECEADEDWQLPCFDDERFKIITSDWARAGAVLMGRGSFAGYEKLHQHHRDSPVVHFSDPVPRYVASTTLTEVSWPGTTVLRDDLENQLTHLPAAPGTEVLVRAVGVSDELWGPAGSTVHDDDDESAQRVGAGG